MNEKNILTDDMLDPVSGGMELTKGVMRKEAYSVVIMCPKCGKSVKQIFYKDGGIKYPECPHCHTLLGVG